MQVSNLLVGLLAGGLLAACTTSAPLASAPSSPPAPADAAESLIKPFFLCYKEQLRTLHPYQLVQLTRAGTGALDTAQATAYLRAVTSCGPTTTRYRATLARRLRQLAAPAAAEGPAPAQEADPVVLTADTQGFIACVDTAVARLRHATARRRVYSLPAGIPLLVSVVRVGAGWQLDAVEVDEPARPTPAAAGARPR